MSSHILSRPKYYKTFTLMVFTDGEGHRRHHSKSALYQMRRNHGVQSLIFGADIDIVVSHFTEIECQLISTVISFMPDDIT